MARRVFLHIGAMKSATTYIQDLCDVNQEALLGQGLFWPTSPRSFGGTQALLGTTAANRASMSEWTTLDAMIQAHDGDVFLSNELLAAIDDPLIGKVVDAMQPARVEVVITARDLARVIPSQWQTMTRNRQTVPWKDFVAAIKSRRRPKRGTTAGMFWRKQDLAKIVQRWSAFVPLEQITVVTVPPQGSPRSVLVERFGSVIGIDLDELAQPTRSNPALGGPSAELLRRLNLRTADWTPHNYRLAFKNAAARYVLEARASYEPKVSLSQKDLKWVRQRSEKMIEETRATGVHVVGDLDDLLPTVELPKSPADPGAVSDAEMLEVAEYTAVGLGKLLAEVRVEYRKLVESYAQLDPIDTESEEWLEYLPIENAGGGDARAGTRRGRFLLWRNERRRAAEGQVEETLDAEPTEQAESRS